MNPLVKVTQCGVHGAVPGDAVHRGKGGCMDAHREMTVTRAVIARMPRMLVAFVHDLQLGWLKGACQACFNLFRNFHFV